MDLKQYYQSPEIENARQRAEQAGDVLRNYQSASAKLPQALKDAVMKKLEYNKDIIQQKNEAASEYFSAPAEAREKYEDVWDPTKREKLVAQERAMAYQPYANLVDIEKNRMGNISDIINTANQAMKSEALLKQGAYEKARQAYQDMFGMADALASADQAEQNMALRQKEFDLRKEKASGTYDKETEEEKVRGLIKEAARAKKNGASEEEIRNYILSEGYNPDTTIFSGLFEPKEEKDWTEIKAQQSVLGENYEYNPETGKFEYSEPSLWASLWDWLW